MEMGKKQKQKTKPSNQTRGDPLHLFRLVAASSPSTARAGWLRLSPPARGSREKVGRRSERLFPRCVCTCARSRLPGAGAGDRNCSGHRQSDGSALGARAAGGGGDASVAAESPAARTHPGRPALAPPPPSPPSSGRTGELGYQLPPPTPTPLPARAFCGNAPGRFHHPLPAATRPRVSAAGRTAAPRWGRHVTRLGEGVRRRGGQVVLGLPPLGLRSFPIWVPVALGRREGRGGRPGGRR